MLTRKTERVLLIVKRFRGRLLSIMLSFYEWLIECNRERAATNLQLISDLCDLTIPSTALAYTNLDDGIVGLAGTVSSLIGVWATWKKTA